MYFNLKIDQGLKSLWSVYPKDLYVEGPFKLDISIFPVKCIVKTDCKEHTV